MRFYVLGDRRTDEWTYEASAGRMNPTTVGDAPECAACHGLVGMLPWLAPYHVEIIVHGSKLGDLIKGSGMSLLVSDGFRKAWENEGLQGITEFSPLTRLRIRPARLGRQPHTYFHITPQHFKTRVDLARSLMEFERPITCYVCINSAAESIRGFTIDESSWSGEDLFIAWGIFGSVIVTDRVRQMRDKYGLTNMNMTPVEEYLSDPYKLWTPVDYSRDEPPPEVEEVVDDNGASLN